jgi:hypothetical protein
MIKKASKDGCLEFSQQEVLVLVRNLGYTSKKRRVIQKVFKKAINSALRRLTSGA